MSTTSSPPTSSLDDGLREQDDIFAPSSDSREPIGDLLAAKMGKGVYRQRGSLPMSLQIWFTCLGSQELGDSTAF